jgi:hypothetical protein
MSDIPLHQLELSPEEYERYLNICRIRKMDCSKEDVYTKRRQSKREGKQDLEQTPPNFVDLDVRASESYKKWYQKNKAAKAAYNARWYKENKERLKEKFKADYQRNKARILAKKLQAAKQEK